MSPAQFHEKLQRVWEYWRSKRSERDIPKRRDIDPVEIPSLLQHISLFEIEGGRFRFKIVARHMVDAYGFEPRGKFLDEALPRKRAAEALRAYEMAVKLRRPVYCRSIMTTSGNVEFPLSRILLPLSGDGEEVQFILGGFVIENWRDIGKPPLGRETSVDPETTAIQVLDEGDLLQ